MYLKNVKSGLVWEIVNEQKAAKMQLNGEFTPVDVKPTTAKTPMYKGKALANMTVAELKVIAAENKIDLTGSEKKDDLMKVLIERLTLHAD